MDVVLHPHSLYLQILNTDKFPVICNEVSEVFFLNAVLYVLVYVYISVFLNILFAITLSGILLRDIKI